MSDVPFQHPGSVPPRPEVPEGIVPGPMPQPAEAAAEPDGLPAFAIWTPFAAAGVALVVTVVAVGLISIVVEAAGGRVSGEDMPPGITIGGTLVQGMALMGAAILFAGVGGVRASPAAFGLRRTRFWRALGLAVGAAIAFYVFSFIWSVALGITEQDDLPGELGAKDSALNFAAVAFMVCIAAPLAEEFFFRGFCFPALATRLGWVGGALATGIIFGAIHLGGTKAVFLVPLMILGFLLCVLYKLTGSILPCIALHAVNNGLALSVFMDFEVWQGAIAVIGAPLVCLAVTLPLSRRGRPALA